MQQAGYTKDLVNISDFALSYRNNIILNQSKLNTINNIQRRKE